MEMVSLDQSHEVIAKVQTNCAWDAISSEQARAAYADPIRLGREFTRLIQNGGRVSIMMTDGIIPPPGGRIQILSVPVDESKPWEDAVKAAGPNTGPDWEIWKVGKQYPPLPGFRPSLKQVVLANFGRAIESSEEALVWGREQKLVPSTPRVIFSVGEHYPELNQHLEMESMAVVSLKQCSCGGDQCAPYVWFDGSERGASLLRFAGRWGGHGWFAFVRE